MFTKKPFVLSTVFAVLLGTSTASFARETQPGCDFRPSVLSFTETESLQLPLLSEVVEASENGYTVYGHVRLSCPLTCGAVCGGIVFPQQQFRVYLLSDSPALSVPEFLDVNLGHANGVGTFPIDVRFVSNDKTVRIYASLNSDLSEPLSKELKVLDLKLTSFSLNPLEVVGGDNVSSRVQLNHPVGETLNLSVRSTDPDVASGPRAGARMERGEDATSFQITTRPVPTETEVRFSTGMGGSETLTVLPGSGGEGPGGPVTLEKFLLGGVPSGWTKTFSPDPSGFLDLLGYVELSGPAPAGGVTVQLIHEGPVDTNYVTHGEFLDGPTLFVPAGSASGTFTFRLYPCRHYVQFCKCDGLVSAKYDEIKASVHIVVDRCEALNPVQAATVFRRGDTNADGTSDLSDGLATLGFLFTGDEEPSCLKASDANDDGLVDVSDPMFLLSYLFLGTAPPKAPFESCGVDPTDDELSCQGQDACVSSASDAE